MLFPVELLNTTQRKAKKQTRTIFSFAYQEDLDQAYAFYCSRYENITYKEFMDLGFSDFKRKLGSIPESEPLYKILKSRSIDLSKIKDKDERKYWQELKRLNEIPPIFISDEEQNRNLESIVKNNRMFGGK